MAESDSYVVTGELLRTIPSLIDTALRCVVYSPQEPIAYMVNKIDGATTGNTKPPSIHDEVYIAMGKVLWINNT